MKKIASLLLFVGLGLLNVGCDKPPMKKTDTAPPASGDAAKTPPADTVTPPADGAAAPVDRYAPVDGAPATDSGAPADASLPPDGAPADSTTPGTEPAPDTQNK